MRHNKHQPQGRQPTQSQRRAVAYTVKLVEDNTQIEQEPSCPLGGSLDIDV